MAQVFSTSEVDTIKSLTTALQRAVEFVNAPDKVQAMLGEAATAESVVKEHQAAQDMLAEAEAIKAENEAYSAKLALHQENTEVLRSKAEEILASAQERLEALAVQIAAAEATQKTLDNELYEVRQERKALQSQLHKVSQDALDVENQKIALDQIIADYKTKLSTLAAL